MSRFRGCVYLGWLAWLATVSTSGMAAPFTPGTLVVSQVGNGVLASGTVVHDCVRGVELRGTREAPLEIPEGAVVVPGTRPLRPDDPVARAWAEARGLQVACALIVKYRDERTDRATALEQALR